MKDFLKNNKIYFEILSSVMFGGGAILISFAAYNLSKEQVEISKISNRPHFYIEVALRKDPDTKFYNDSEQYIYNSGAPVHNLSIDSNEFIEVEFFGNNPRKEILPISGYYFGQFRNHSPVGLLTTFKGPGNNAAMSALDFASLEYTKSHDEYFELHLKVLVSISYTDFDGTDKTDYFLNRQHVSYNTVSDSLKIYETKPFIEIRKTTVESILGAIK